VAGVWIKDCGKAGKGIQWIQIYLEKAGWKRGQNTLDQVLPGMMIGGDIYYNDNGHLPDVPGRIWYEADLDYYGGKRGAKRLLYSNDGLLFVTYDHYHTFVEVVEEDEKWRVSWKNWYIN